MPTKWVPPKVFLKYKGVTVYHTYRNDDIEMPHRDYWYGWREDCCEERDSFDVRDLPNPHRYDLDTDQGKRAVLREVIDAGIVTKGGIVTAERPNPFVTLRLPAESWKVLAETLRLDASSSAFDPQLRHRIHEALASVEVVHQPDEPFTALRRIFDFLYLQTDEQGEKRYNPAKSWDADMLEAVAQIVRPFFPELQSVHGDEDRKS